MIENMNEIQKGMDVYGTDGEKIGSIDDVYSGNGSPAGTTWQAGRGGVGNLDVETVDRGDTTYHDPTAPGANYTNTSGTDTSYRDPTARGADYTNTTPPGSTYTDPTSPTTGSYTGTGATSDIGGISGTTDATGTSDYAGTGMSDFDNTGEIVDTDDTTETTYFAGVVETTTIGGAGMTTGYFKVKEGGLFGIGGTDLYIPFSAVTNVEPGDNLTIDCTKDEAASRYSEQPSSLDDSDTPLT